MQEYDAALKLLLQASASSIVRQATGLHITRWLNVELPRTHMQRADLLGMTSEGHLIHIELQSSNDGKMVLRMAEYALAIYRQFGKFPKQIVLYVGEPRLLMKAALSGPDPAQPDFAFRYTLLDIRDLNSTALLASPHIEDNVLAILTRLQDQAATIREILQRIATLDESERRAIFAQLLIISGLRRLEPIVEEARKMPILNSILDHQVIGPAIRQGRQEGRQEMLRLMLKKDSVLFPLGWKCV
jgi:predicted transposase/invertase (TIGR01784 family)